MLYNVVIKYEADGELHTLNYTSARREDCENKAIRFICASPEIKVISITFKEEEL